MVQEGQILGYNFLSHHQLLELVSCGGKAIVLVLAGEEGGNLMLLGFFLGHTVKTKEAEFCSKIHKCSSCRVSKQC